MGAATSTLQQLGEALSGKATSTAAQATEAGQELWNAFLGINWSNPTWDLIILVVFGLAVFVLGFALGRDRLVAIMISTYIALAVATNFPYVDKLTELMEKTGVTALRLSTFLVLFAATFVMLSRSMLLQSLTNLSGSWWQVIILAVLQVGLLISIVLSFLPSEVLEQFSIFTQTLFLSDLAKFAWITLPVLALAAFKGKKKRNRYSDI